MRHVLLDLYGCDPDLLADEAHLRRVLEDYPARLHMQRVSPVFLENITATSDPRDAGHSGFVIIATSHVSLHSWPPYRMVNLDLFSCNDFDVDEAVAFARTTFDPADLEVRSIWRATRSPRQTHQIASQDRPLALDGCLHPGCLAHTGNVLIPYCEEHRPGATPRPFL